MQSTRSRSTPRWQVPVLLVLAALSLLAGLGLREPMPADEPRFVLSARTMVETGDWLFPRRGSELYAEKPPTFMWTQAASYLVVRNWNVAFLLPSLIAALATLWLTGDLARRLWGPRAARCAVLGLFVCIQFGLQAKKGQIDMVLLCMTTLSLWALVRYLLETPRPWLLALGTFAAGLGTVTKGVGFLPLLVFVPWLWARAASPRPLPSHRGVHAFAGVAGFVLGLGTWLAPMLYAVASSGDAALHAYAREMLFRQTTERYANAWHHVKPWWYYLQTMATLWLPGVLLAPWLLPAWWRRLRRHDAGHILLLGWSLLALAFFTLSPGKREVYILPLLPALCVAAAPLVPPLLRRRAVRIVLWSWLLVLAAAAIGLGAWLNLAAPERLLRLTEGRGLDSGALEVLAAWLLTFGVSSLAVMAAVWWRHRGAPAVAVVLVTCMLWITHGMGLMPALSPDVSARALMERVGQHIGPDARLAMLGWREQHLLQADRPVVDFGFNRPWPDQWVDARRWLAADPGRNWLFVLREAMVPCLDPALVIDIGESNRRSWVLVPGDAWIPGCEIPGRD